MSRRRVLLVARIAGVSFGHSVAQSNAPTSSLPNPLRAPGAVVRRRTRSSSRSTPDRSARRCGGNTCGTRCAAPPCPALQGRRSFSEGVSEQALCRCGCGIELDNLGCAPQQLRQSAVLVCRLSVLGGFVGAALDQFTRGWESESWCGKFLPRPMMCQNSRWLPGHLSG